jgi:hypothetical protein
MRKLSTNSKKKRITFSAILALLMLLYLLWTWLSDRTKLPPPPTVVRNFISQFAVGVIGVLVIAIGVALLPVWGVLGIGLILFGVAMVAFSLFKVFGKKKISDQRPGEIHYLNVEEEKKKAGIFY